jgi:hypothetical protein
MNLRTVLRTSKVMSGIRMDESGTKIKIPGRSQITPRNKRIMTKIPRKDLDGVFLIKS